jgi:hypothetical protein
MLVEGHVADCSTFELLIAIKHGAQQALNCKQSKVAASST